MFSFFKMCATPIRIHAHLSQDEAILQAVMWQTDPELSQNPIVSSFLKIYEFNPRWPEINPQEFIIAVQNTLQRLEGKPASVTNSASQGTIQSEFIQVLTPFFPEFSVDPLDTFVQRWHQLNPTKSVTELWKAIKTADATLIKHPSWDDFSDFFDAIKSSILDTMTENLCKGLDPTVTATLNQLLKEVVSEHSMLFSTYYKLLNHLEKSSRFQEFNPMALIHECCHYIIDKLHQNFEGTLDDVEVELNVLQSIIAPPMHPSEFVSQWKQTLPPSLQEHVFVTALGIRAPFHSLSNIQESIHHISTYFNLKDGWPNLNTSEEKAFETALNHIGHSHNQLLQFLYPQDPQNLPAVAVAQLGVDIIQHMLSETLVKMVNDNPQNKLTYFVWDVLTDRENLPINECLNAIIAMKNILRNCNRKEKSLLGDLERPTEADKIHTMEASVRWMLQFALENPRGSEIIKDLSQLLPYFTAQDKDQAHLFKQVFSTMPDSNCGIHVLTATQIIGGEYTSPAAPQIREKVFHDIAQIWDNPQHEHPYSAIIRGLLSKQFSEVINYITDPDLRGTLPSFYHETNLDPRLASFVKACTDHQQDLATQSGELREHRENLTVALSHFLTQQASQAMPSPLALSIWEDLDKSLTSAGREKLGGFEGPIARLQRAAQIEGFLNEQIIGSLNSILNHYIGELFSDETLTAPISLYVSKKDEVDKYQQASLKTLIDGVLPFYIQNMTSLRMILMPGKELRLLNSFEYLSHEEFSMFAYVLRQPVVLYQLDGNFQLYEIAKTEDIPGEPRHVIFHQSHFNLVEPAEVTPRLPSVTRPKRAAESPPVGENLRRGFKPIELEDGD